jgi:hypothetical protein
MRTALQGKGASQPDYRLADRRQAIAAIEVALASLSAVKTSLRVAAANASNETECGRLESVMADCVEPAIRDLESILKERKVRQPTGNLKDPPADRSCSRSHHEALP